MNSYLENKKGLTLRSLLLLSEEKENESSTVCKSFNRATN